MTTAELKALLDDARCIQKCIPGGLQLSALISLVNAGGMTAAQLIESARCLNSCIPKGLQLAALISLVSGSVVPASPETPSAPCVNLIPNGAMYDDNGLYSLAPLLTQGASYKLTFGGSDFEFDNPSGSPTVLNSPGTFQFTNSSINAAYLTGNAINSLVTATICLVSLPAPLPLSFMGIEPGSIPSDANNPNIAIAGTGFLSSGINAVKLQSGITSGVWIGGTLNIFSDTEIDLSGGVFYVPPGTYTLTVSYSTDGTATWTDTGLTVTTI